MRGATGTAKREAAERRIEQQRQPARNPKAGNIIACSRANGKIRRTGMRSRRAIGDKRRTKYSYGRGGWRMERADGLSAPSQTQRRAGTVAGGKMIHGTQLLRAKRSRARRGLLDGKCPKFSDAIRQKVGDCRATHGKPQGKRHASCSATTALFLLITG